MAKKLLSSIHLPLQAAALVLVALSLAGSFAPPAAGQQPPVKPNPPELSRPFSPTLTELWRALNNNEILKELQQQGLDPKDVERLRLEFDRANAELRKSWDSFSRVVPYYPAYARAQPFGVPRTGRLGVLLEPPGPTLIEQLSLPKGQGAVVCRVAENSPAAKVGLKAHDILMKIGGKAVPIHPLEFTQLVQGLPANTPLEVEVVRKGKTEILKGLSLPALK